MKGYFFFFLSLCAFFCVAQNPTDFLMSSRSEKVLFPHYVDSTSRFSLKTGHNAGFGILNNFSNTFISVNEWNTKKKYHLGFSFINQKEGDFFNKNKGLLNITRSILLKRQLQLRFGLSLGLNNYSFSATPSTPGANDFVPDGDFGFALSHKKTTLAFGINQMFQQKIQPLQFSFEITPMYYTTLNHKIRVSNFWMLDLVGDFYLKDQTIKSNVNLEFNYLKKYFFGGGFRLNEGLQFNAGLIDIEISPKTKVNLSIFYFNKQFINSSKKFNFLEIGLGTKF